MKRRTQEFLDEAERFLGAARVLLDAGIPENSAAESYGAMRSAAQAALSEANREAKSHHGVWVLFDQYYVATGRVESSMRAAARRAQELRDDSEYRLGGATSEEAEWALEAAREFIQVIRGLFS